ncbi:hypothetical protein Taro_043249 [Colocasia esculenta]|uniref:O-fucosyltransferase family protein n=1 Tax=Colocasia esculenta TaxID=4460 RepID=A0A843WKK8_COLES|nr:hypothetical protein [Colocasia esculenta]
MVLMRAREAAQREFEESDYMRFKNLKAPEADEQGWLISPTRSTTGAEGTSLGQHFGNISLKEQPTLRYNQEDPDMTEGGSSDEAHALWYPGIPSPEKLRSEGQCPLTPEEAVLMLAALGFKRKARMYVAGANIYGGKSRIAALISLYPNLATKESLLTSSEIEPFINFSSQIYSGDLPDRLG